MARNTLAGFTIFWSSISDNAPMRHPCILIRRRRQLESWIAVHRPALERASAFFVIITPGLKTNLGPDDWVHKEIDWWLAHRLVPPLLVDATGEGYRWVPDKVSSKWPQAQLIRLDPELWTHASSGELALIRKGLVDQISGSVDNHRFRTVSEELNRSKKTNKRLKVALNALVILFGFNLTLIGYAYRAKNDAEHSFQLALKASIQEARQRQLALDILEWIIPETIPFSAADGNALTLEGGRILRGMIKQLGLLGFQGDIVVEAHMTDRGSPESQIAAGDKVASSISAFIRTLDTKPGIQVRSVVYGDDKTSRNEIRVHLIPVK